MNDGDVYTYYYGVMCVGCGKFIMLNSYQTTHRLGLVDVTLGVAFRCRRPECGQTCIYHREDVVYSKSPDEMVPLDR